ncbi:MAG: hypothetical protein AB1645_02835 [Bacillota bacterium]
MKATRSGLTVLERRQGRSGPGQLVPDCTFKPACHLVWDVEAAAFVENGGWARGCRLTLRPRPRALDQGRWLAR